jgi:aminopeptidase N
VDTHDFMKTVKEVTGRNMDWFFEQFLFRPGHPVFDIRSEWDETRGEIRLTVAQVQAREHGVPTYRTPVQIGLTTPAGKRVETVWLESEVAEFVFPSTERPLLVRFDEGNWLLKEWSYRKDVDELLYQSRNDDVIGREWAVRELLRFKDDPRVAIDLARIAAADSFWAVRLAAIETAVAVDPDGSRALLRTAATDARSQVRRAAVRLLGQSGDPALIGFFRDRFAQDDSYQVQAEALRAIGRSAGRDQLPFLREASGIESHQDVVRVAAEWAMEEISRRR